MIYKNQNDSYFKKHFAQLVKKYGGKWIVIANGKMVGITPVSGLKELIKLARKKFPKDTPLVAPIPREEEIYCIL